MELLNGPLILRDEKNDRKVDDRLKSKLYCFGSDASLSWYTNRRPYRSVAFGTWKVGNASEITNRTRQTKELAYTRSLDANRNYLLNTDAGGLKVDRRHLETSETANPINKKRDSIKEAVSEESEGEGSEVEDDHVNSTAKNQEEYEPQMSDSNDDVPSNRKFMSASNIDAINGNRLSMDEHATIVLDIKSGQQINEMGTIQGNASLILDKKKKALFSMHRPHQRSRSVGNVTVYGVGTAPSTSAVKNKSSAAFSLSRSSSNRTHGSLNAIAATKRFLKMLYDSATINSRLRSKNSSATEITPATVLPFQTSKPFFEIRYSSDMDDRENVENEFNSVSLALRNDDCESTPSTMKSTDTDDSMNTSLITKSGCSAESRRTSFSDFQSWAEVFEHLKREIVAIRERDAQILADLRKVETQIQNVKKRSVSATPRSEYFVPIDISNQKLGDLVESMPL